MAPDISSYVTERWGPRLLLVHPNGRFVYVANWDLNTISAYAIDPASGALTPLPGAPYRTGKQPRAITIDPAGRFLYSGNWGSADVTGYAVDAATGELAAIPGSPFRVGRRPRNLRLDPTGTFGYVSNRDDGDISAFTVDAATGALIPMPRPRVPAGTLTRTTVIDRAGRHACAAHQFADTISFFNIDPVTRDLVTAPGGPFTVGADPRSVTFDPASRFVYTANRGSDNVSVHAIDPATGRLAPVPGSPFPCGHLPFAFQFHPGGRAGYVACPGSNNIWAYVVDTGTGMLTPLAAAPFAAGRFPVWPTFTPDGRYLFINATDSNEVHGFAVDECGGLRPVPGSPFPAGAADVPGTHPREIVTDPAGRFLFFANRKSDTVDAFRIDPSTGSLARAPGSPFAPCGRPTLWHRWKVLEMKARALVGRDKAHSPGQVRRNAARTRSLVIDCAVQPVIIIGSPRSGTTLLTNLLARLGLFMGHQRVDDEEARFFFDANRAIVKRAHGYWDHPAAMRYLLRHVQAVEETARCLAEEVRSRRIVRYLGLRRYLRNGGVAALDEPWGWKDPVNTFTLPLWLKVFPKARVIHIVRNGVDVADSLRQMEERIIAQRRAGAESAIGRFRYPTEMERRGFKGAARCLFLDGAFSLWEEYVAQGDEVVAPLGDRAVTLRYEDFLAEPGRWLAELSRFCGLAPASDAVMNELAGSVKPGRANACLNEPGLRGFYEQVRASPCMARHGYSQLTG